jgi:hypothetical protein
LLLVNQGLEILFTSLKLLGSQISLFIYEIIVFGHPLTLFLILGLSHFLGFLLFFSSLFNFHRDQFYGVFLHFSLGHELIHVNLLMGFWVWDVENSEVFIDNVVLAETAESEVRE